MATAAAVPTVSQARDVEAPPAVEARLLVGFTPRAVATGAAGDAHDAAGAEDVEHLRSVSAYVVEVEDRDAAIASYLAQPGVRYVEVDHEATAFSADPLFVNQWNMKQLSGSNKGTANVEPAWAHTTGEGVTVAVADTGVRTGGTDLDPGRVLDGYDFVNEDADPTDDHGHGTHVAGTIAQSTNNDRGVAGVAPDARILPVKVLNASGAGSYSDIIAGIVWAKDQGARVINLSLGAPEFSQALCDAVTNAANAGVVVVAATGNDGLNSLSYPAACDAAVAVGAVRYDGQVAGYSNYGPKIDLVGPGGDLSIDQDGDGYADGILQQNFTTSWAYRFYEGTSMAAPHVAGVAALVLAVNPTADVPALLTETARDVAPAGRDDRSGYGALDAAAAVERAGAGGNTSATGYWLASDSGQVRGFGAAPNLGSPSTRGSRAKLVAIHATSSGTGYLAVDRDGGVHAFGDARYFGSLTELKAAGQAPKSVGAIDIATTPSGGGYWILDADGGIYTFGDAVYHGGVPGLREQGVRIGSAPVIDMASTPSGRGYYVLDRAGGMFTFGDAVFTGSVPALRNAGHKIGPADIMGMAATGDGDYYMVDDVGGMFAFGDLPFHGSLPGLRNSGINIGPTTVVAMEPTGDGGGYWLVGRDGGIFTFGNALYHGSFPAAGVQANAVGIAPSAS